MIKKFILFTMFILLLLLLMFLSYVFYLDKKESNINNDKIENLEILKTEDTIIKSIDDTCLYSIPIDNEIDIKLNELKTYIINNYPNSSVMYYDINSKYTFKYNEDEVYYGASLIKVIEALYIYEQASINPSILEEELTYLSKYKVPHSEGLEKYKIGDNIKIRDLVKHLISVSDNSAHFMLFDYIGFDKLKEYGNMIGNKYTLVGGDKYGNIDLNGAYSYLYRLNEFINNNLEYGTELKSYFDNDYFNSLDLESTNFIHKYGNYDIFFHDIGISDSKDSYILVVLTKYGYNNKEKTINDISLKINEFHNFYINKKIEICNK